MAAGISQRKQGRTEAEREIDKITKSLDEAKTKQDTISREIARLSGKIPTLLAFDQEVEEIYGSIKKLTEDSNKLGQTITGYRQRIADLKKEISFLENEIQEDEWLLMLYSGVHIADYLNRSFGEAIRALEEYYEFIDWSGFTSHPLTGNQKIIYPSRRDALEIIPKFFLIGDIEELSGNGRPKDLWNYSSFKYERRAKKQAENE